MESTPLFSPRQEYRDPEQSNPHIVIRPLPAYYDQSFRSLVRLLYDALLSTINAPERSEYSTWLWQQLRTYLAYLHLYYFSEYVKGWYKELEDLPEPIQEVCLALRLENQPRFW
ncbi:hypothetical protein DXG03_008062 [Asterophora parasitica]|uniref:Uncharacterized protein n=1 Tax=Asterophora parasitica TaxID=117018 RepID=A0A9P7FYE0_9AGAR|nr:hypothetical protein DXG03_008062 [Asterophora parasitica]